MSYKKFVKNIGVMSFTSFVSTLGGIVLLPIITKLLGASEYGIWVVFITMTALAPLLLTLGLPLALGRFLPGEKDKKQVQDGIYSTFVIVISICLLLSIFIIFFSNQIADLLNVRNATLTMLLAPIFLFECLNLVCFAIIRAFQKVKAYSFFIVFAGSGQPALVIALILMGWGIFGAILSLLLIRIILFIIMFTFIARDVGFKVPQFLNMKEYIFLGAPTLGGYMSSWIIKSSDRHFINSFLGIIFVGYYAPGIALGNILSLVLAPLSFILPAILAEHFDSNRINEIKKYLEYSLKYFLILSIPGAFGLSLLSKQIMTIFSTTEIASNGYLITIFASFGVLFYGICDIFDQILLMFKKTKITSMIWMVIAIINIALNLMLIPYLGIIGAGIALLTTMLLAAVITCFYSIKYLKFNFKIDWIFISKIIIASALMGSIALIIHPSGFYKTMITVVSSVLIYVILLFVFRCFNENELNFLKGLIRRI